MAQRIGYCAYCGKGIYEHEDHCHKCGHRTDDITDVPPQFAAAHEKFPTVEQMRDRSAPIGWYIVASVVIFIGLVAVGYNGLSGLFTKTSEPVDPAVAIAPPPADVPILDSVELVPAAPAGAVASVEDAVSRVQALLQEDGSIARIRATGGTVKMRVADQDEETYLVEVYQASGGEEDDGSGTTEWYIVQRADGEVYLRPEAAADVRAD